MWSEYGLTRDGIRQVWKGHCQVLDRIGELQGLGKLFVHLIKPWLWLASRAHGMLGREIYHIKEERYDMEAELEKQIMGPTYNSEALGKRRQPMSAWHETFWWIENDRRNPDQ